MHFVHEMKLAGNTIYTITKEVCMMPYHKDKQQSFQAAQQGYEQAKAAQKEIVTDSSDYGKQLSHLEQEVNEAYEQINNALETASEHQHEQLRKFQNDLSSIVNAMRFEE